MQTMSLTSLNITSRISPCLAGRSDSRLAHFTSKHRSWRTSNMHIECGIDELDLNILSHVCLIIYKRKILVCLDITPEPKEGRTVTCSQVYAIFNDVLPAENCFLLKTSLVRSKLCIGNIIHIVMGCVIFNFSFSFGSKPPLYPSGSTIERSC